MRAPTQQDHEILLRRCTMLSSRITRHETESGKSASWDRREMGALRRVLFAQGVCREDIPDLPREVFGPCAPLGATIHNADGVRLGTVLRIVPDATRLHDDAVTAMEAQTTDAYKALGAQLLADIGSPLHAGFKSATVPAPSSIWEHL
jgi:hypothetical protein